MRTRSRASTRRGAGRSQLRWVSWALVAVVVVTFLAIGSSSPSGPSSPGARARSLAEEIACPQCAGLGTVSEFDLDLVLPDPELPVSEAIEPWRRNGPRMNVYYSRLMRRFCERMKSGNLMPSRRKNTGVLLPTRS